MASEKSYWQDFAKGLYRENPISRLMLGLCPTLAVTSAAINGIGMGMATTFVLVGSNAIISIIKGVVPKKIRIPIYIVVIATFVSIVEMAMAAYFPALSHSLGIYIPLIVVNCIVLGRAEAFACKNTFFRSALDGLGMGLGFTVFITCIAMVREIIGDGKVFGFPLLGQSYEPMLLMILPPGGFILLGLVLGFIAWSDQKNKMREVLVRRNAPKSFGLKKTA